MKVSCNIPFSKVADDDQRLVYGSVYSPDLPDTDAEFMTADEIQKMAHDFLMEGLVHAIDTNHNLQENGSSVVESFIARKGDPDFKEGSWVLGVKVSEDLWPMVKSGELNGFSMYGHGTKLAKEIEFELPPGGVVKGETEENEDHLHTYMIKFDTKTGEFIGGVTDDHKDGSSGHIIKRGTVTEVSNGHSHRYAISDHVEIAGD